MSYCDDCISRQGIIKKAFIVEYTDMWHMTVSERVVSVKDIEEMPSVTPTERTGHWIKGNMDEGIYCSECKAKALTEDNLFIKSKYCPSCGAKMIENDL